MMSLNVNRIRVYLLTPEEHEVIDEPVALNEVEMS